MRRLYIVGEKQVASARKLRRSLEVASASLRITCDAPPLGSAALLSSSPTADVVSALRTSFVSFGPRARLADLSSHNRLTQEGG